MRKKVDPKIRYRQTIQLLAAWLESSVENPMSLKDERRLNKILVEIVYKEVYNLLLDMADEIKINREKKRKLAVTSMDRLIRLPKDSWTQYDWDYYIENYTYVDAKLEAKLEEE
jgi:hypothetical protein